MTDIPASKQIDTIIENLPGWKRQRITELRALVKETIPAAIEEVKWKKPSKPEGVPVWYDEGIVCIAEALKNAVRLTFPKGAEIDDPAHIFNTRLDSKSVRAIDFAEDDQVDTLALKELFTEAARINKTRS